MGGAQRNPSIPGMVVVFASSLELESDGFRYAPPILPTFRKRHQELVQEVLTNDGLFRQRESQWTESIAVGSKSFIETIKEKLGPLANGRQILKNKEGFQLREEMAGYIFNNDSQNDNIGLENTHFLDFDPYVSSS